MKFTFCIYSIHPPPPPPKFISNSKEIYVSQINIGCAVQRLSPPKPKAIRRGCDVALLFSSFSNLEKLKEVALLIFLDYCSFLDLYIATLGGI